MALTPPPPIPQRGDRTTFASRVDAFLTWEGNTLVPELNALQANLSSLAAGGAYAIPYLIRSAGTPIGGPNGAQMAFNNAAVSGTTAILVDTKDARGAAVGALLTSMTAGATSAVKGQIRVQKVGDTSKWAVFNATSAFSVDSGAYAIIGVQYAWSSDASPFSDLDAVMLFFQRTGDKGDVGATSAYPVMLLRDQRGPGVAAQPLTGLAWTARVLNTATTNEIPGASLASNQFTLPAGKYWIDARASGYSCGAHQIRLSNITDGGAYDQGVNEFGNYVSFATASTAELRTVITLNSSKTFRIDHWAANTNGSSAGGQPASSSAAEIYAEVKITKVA